MTHLLLGVLYNDTILLDECIGILTERYGAVADSFDYPFDVTDYYEIEMGKELRRRLLVFKRKVGEEELAHLKRDAILLEEMFKTDGRRRLNIDPGYIASDEFVFASTKGKSYKKELRGGIFAHIVLEFRDNEVRVFFHTFPDFRKRDVQQFIMRRRPSD